MVSGPGKTLKSALKSREGSLVESVLETFLALVIVIMIATAAVSGMNLLSVTSSDAQRLTAANQLAEVPERIPGWKTATSGAPITKNIKFPNGLIVTAYLYAKVTPSGIEATVSVPRATTKVPSVCRTTTIRIADCLYATGFIFDRKAAMLPAAVPGFTTATGAVADAGAEVASANAPSTATKWRFYIDARSYNGGSAIYVSQGGVKKLTIPVLDSGKAIYGTLDVTPGARVQFLVGDNPIQVTKVFVYPIGGL
ncbi:hypothetical protein ACFVAJ_16840 [Agromyces sp. NPDC057679]|uniref:hypothetical protein n=1 Tax=Agromyces sp. NPDC057679 TaxID=3346207 RepID=UPI00366B676A